jgi:hypothetical protein
MSVITGCRIRLTGQAFCREPGDNARPLAGGTSSEVSTFRQRSQAWRLVSRRSTLSQSSAGLTGLTSSGTPTSIRNLEYSGENADWAMKITHGASWTSGGPVLRRSSDMAYKVPPLRVAYDGLQPHIDAETMSITTGITRRTLTT